MNEQTDTTSSPETPRPSDEMFRVTSEAAAKAIRAGQFAPTFRLEDIHGGTARMVDLLEQGPLVMSFYRGIWCDFCDLALEGLAKIDGQIRELGAHQVAIGPAPTGDSQRRRLLGFPMPVLVDSGLRVTASFGLTVPVPSSERERYASLGYAPPNASWLVPIPATYVLDRSGKVVVAAIDADYRNRLEPDQILSTLRCLRQRDL